MNNLPDMYPGKKKDEIPQFVPPPPPPAFISQSSPWQLLDKVFNIGESFVNGFNKPSNQSQIQNQQNGWMNSNQSGNYQQQQPLNFPSNPF